MTLLGLVCAVTWSGMYREWTYGILYRLDDRDMYILAQVNTIPTWSGM